MEVNKSKYKRVVNFVIEKIHNGEYKKGYKIPSVNDFIRNFNISRDTAFAGINELKSRGIIASVPGVGYFISNTRIPSQNNIFLLFNELNEFKEDLYNSFIETVNKTDFVDLYFHNYNKRVFENLLNDANGKYTTYIIMSGKFQGIEPLLQSLSGRVFLLDHFHSELKGKYSSVFQNFEKDTYEALVFGLPYVKKYKRLIMVQSDEKEPYERFDGLQRFCKEYGFDYKYLNSIKSRDIKQGDLFILVNDRDLVDLLKLVDKQNFNLSQNVGIISYNDTPLKEILAGGITTLSTDFKQMGKTMAKLISQKATETIENPWNLNIRKSL
jgi:DNA-binding transcriptional regulator YhcF (GntR family)